MKIYSIFFGFYRWSRGRAFWSGALLGPWRPPSSPSTLPPPPLPSSTPAGGRSATPTKVSSIETLAAAAAATASNEESSNYSSLLDIGQAYGIWNPSEDNSNDMSGPRDLKIVEDEEDEIPTDKDTPEPLKIEYQVRNSMFNLLLKIFKCLKTRL